MHLRPRDRASTRRTLAYRQEFWAFTVYRNRRRRSLSPGMTFNTRRSRRNCRVGGFLYRLMTIATVHLQIPCVQGMAEWHRLLGLIPHVQCRGRESIHYNTTDVRGANGSNSKRDRNQPIDPKRKSKTHQSTTFSNVPFRIVSPAGLCSNR